MIRTCDNGHPPARVLSGTPCAACERRRPSRQARGYDAAHGRARATLAALLPAPCFYCRAVIEAGERFVAAHVVDGDPAAGWAAAHAACNERAKVRRGWGRTGEGDEPAGTRARLLAVRPGFFRFSGRGNQVGPFAECEPRAILEQAGGPSRTAQRRLIQTMKASSCDENASHSRAFDAARARRVLVRLFNASVKSGTVTPGMTWSPTCPLMTAPQEEHAAASATSAEHHGQTVKSDIVRATVPGMKSDDKAAWGGKAWPGW